MSTYLLYLPFHDPNRLLASQRNRRQKPRASRLEGALVQKPLCQYTVCHPACQTPRAGAESNLQTTPHGPQSAILSPMTTVEPRALRLLDERGISLDLAQNPQPCALLAILRAEVWAVQHPQMLLPLGDALACARVIRRFSSMHAGAAK